MDRLNMAALEITTVRTRRELKDFIALPWRLYAQDPNWVPPFKTIQARLLDTEKHPFWRTAARQLYLARRGGEVVGRIMASVDHSYNGCHDVKAGGWGFFECERNPETAMALFGAAEEWWKSRSLDYGWGPVNPSTNYEVGLLVQGYDSPPALMLTYNPPYYLELVHACGWRKDKDLLSYRFSRDWEQPVWARELAARMAAWPDLKIREPDRRDFNEHIIHLNQIYQECWADNWGFSPMSDEELLVAAKEMHQIYDSNFAGFLELRGEVVGAYLMLPDVNPLMQRFNGRMSLGTLIKLKLYWHEVKGLRGLLLGIKKEHRRLGLPLAVLDNLMKALARNPQYEYVELGWNLEDNHEINQLYEADGGVKPHKRWRMYRKDLC